MEVERNASLPFLGVELLHLAPRIKTKVYVKPTSTGLLLHYQSHVDLRYQRSLITTTLDRAYRISSDWSYFSQECDRLEIAFLNPKHFTNLAAKQLIEVREVKPATVNQQCVVYKFQCSLCDAGYVGYTRSHLHEQVDGHKQKSSSICKHYLANIIRTYHLVF